MQIKLTEKQMEAVRQVCLNPENTIDKTAEIYPPVYMEADAIVRIWQSGRNQDLNLAHHPGLQKVFHNLHPFSGEIEPADRIEFVSMKCSGEGYRTHLFVDGRYCLSIPGHSATGEGSILLHRHWSQVDQATVLYQGRPLDTKNPTGYLASDDFKVVYNYIAQPKKEEKLRRRVAPSTAE